MITPRKFVIDFIEDHPFATVAYCAEELMIAFPGRFIYVDSFAFVRKILESISK
jgi:hypothetical protein